MSYVVAVPEFVASAASDLAAIGSRLSAAHLAAAVPTTAVVAAAGDEVSAAIASLFSGHAQQALSAKAAVFHTQFVQALTGGLSRTLRWRVHPESRRDGQPHRRYPEQSLPDLHIHQGVRRIRRLPAVPDQCAVGPECLP